jgi:hypothetical protein
LTTFVAKFAKFQTSEVNELQPENSLHVVLKSVDPKYFNSRPAI